MNRGCDGAAEVPAEGGGRTWAARTKKCCRWPRMVALAVTKEFLRFVLKESYCGTQ